MVRENQIVLDHDECLFTCIACDERPFSSEHALFQHCRSSKLHDAQWCERCKWLFVSDQARAAHIQSSDLHSCCSLCGVDFDDEEELAVHQADTHKYCSQCQLTCHDYFQHRVKVHHRCQECGDEFQNDNNLIMHLQTHLPRTKECYGCLKKFARDSAMFDHLEHDACSSGVTCRMIDDWAFECYQHKHYTNGWNDQYRYRCPTCDENFVYLSALLRHAESQACSVNDREFLGKMKHYIMNRVGEYIDTQSS